ncbi:cation-translocating P-type ATPase [Anaerocolumna sp.]|uniref:cation-translocating P-type ATPase n=1 Tax=Anaerocolumna sp. TaxID=2041569 RepID=UPI0028A689F1|nr:cation-translocating P-type ATPase [Anaerocolumna sp.]
MTDYYGLNLKEIQKRREIYGYNEIRSNNKKKILKQLKHIVSEPIYLLLSCAAIIYFLLGEATDGIFMIAFVIFVIGIDVFQEIRTGNVLKKLKEISEPKIFVIREGKEIQISGRELVPGDLMIIREGVKIPADGFLIKANGLCIDESILTGESVGVWKNTKKHIANRNLADNLNMQPNIETDSKEESFKKDCCYAGTHVIVGTGIVCVEKTGKHTEYGKIAESILETQSTNTGLQIQMKKLAKECSILAAVLFLLVGFFTFLNLSEQELMERIIHSMMAGIVLALSMIPGEFPVILSVFLSMGAYRLAKKNALIRHLPSVETLGSISVLCMDKTGTITHNKMQVSDYFTNKLQVEKFCRTIALACKAGTFDPVEKALIEYGGALYSQCSCEPEKVTICNTDNSVLIKEYPFTNELKAMGQIWRENGYYTIAAKGCPETILSLCYRTVDQDMEVKKQMKKFLKKGLRVIALADRVLSEDAAIPDNLSECKLHFRGIVGLSDPIRYEMIDIIKESYDAGIRIIMITGDHPETASFIAGEVGIHNSNQVITGEMISKLSDLELKNIVKEYNIYARVLPLHKMKIVKALQENGEVVAMTGDGVNDSPAQKTADIGIAMGKHGSEVCREAADLILLDDNISTVISTVRDGRRIYQNIVKAIEYVFTIHIPIALISLVAPILGIGPKSLMLLPLHIVLLELIMDPTCSIALERIPAEDNIMKKPPRQVMEPLFSKARLIKSIIQGLAIFIFSFSIYFSMLNMSYPAEVARTAGFSVLVLSNILLVIENSSEKENIIQAFKKISHDRGIWAVNSITLVGLILCIYSPLHKTLGFYPLGPASICLVMVFSILSVLWFEIVKLKYCKRMAIK